MQTFKREVESILLVLSGSVWATHPEVQEVLAEYRHLARAGWTLTASKRVSLQIFHVCRALDSLLAHIAGNESAKPHTHTHTKAYWTLGSSLAYIKNHTIGSMTFTSTTSSDLSALTTDRNFYLHRANVFPTDAILRVFLTRTIRALQEAVTFPM
jgi:hypothetical protein